MEQNLKHGSKRIRREKKILRYPLTDPSDRYSRSASRDHSENGTELTSARICRAAVQCRNGSVQTFRNLLVMSELTKILQLLKHLRRYTVFNTRRQQKVVTEEVFWRSIRYEVSRKQILGCLFKKTPWELHDRMFLLSH